MLAVNPLFAAPWRVLAGAAEKTGQTAAAIQAWRTLLQLAPPNAADIHYQLARLLHQQGSPEARREVLMALEETPRHRASLKLLQEMPPADSTPTATPAAPASR